ncbi:xanthine dehydrogenase subunit XdhC [[Actinomadura] parvosata]|uniref:xanthine dehydrogenase subunit XdhC n=1 Tax=[Actinomadura] parvosata TaxID=1955412 RepID=UPI001648BB7C
MDAEIVLRADGLKPRLKVDTRTTVLDALLERLGTTSPEKGCDHGKCWAWTVLLDGRRVTNCLMLAVANGRAEIVTAAGLANGGELRSDSGGMFPPCFRADLRAKCPAHARLMSWFPLSRRKTMGCKGAIHTGSGDS